MLQRESGNLSGPMMNRAICRVITCLRHSTRFTVSAVLFICLCVTAASAQWPNSDRVDRQFADSTSVLFLEAVRLIRDHYVEARNEEELYGVAGRRLMFALPPHCTEDLPRWVDCTADPATCLLGTIERIAAKCNIDRRALVVSALKLVLKELDPNCALLDARMLKELDVSTSGRFGGIGMAVAQRDGDYVVISCFEGSPAFDAGIKAGDMVLAIDGEPIHDLPLIEVLGKVRGRAGSPIRLTLRLRGSDDTRQITLKRQSIRISPVRHLMLPGGIGYLRIVNFQNSTAPEVARALRQLTGSSRGKLNGLVLDLRDNPGGLFDQGIQVADMFVPSGPMTFLRGRNASLNREFMATGRAPFAHIPVAVLVNRGTASAAEILAAAIRARPDMVVIGEPSFGKASVQGVYQMRNDMALRLTTAHYYTPDGRDIDGRGIEPDVRLEDANPQEKGTRPRGLDLESLRDDEAIAKALEMLQGEQGVGTPFPTLF